MRCYNRTMKNPQRLIDEEKFLALNLPGYTEYCAKVRWHLLPGIF